MRVKDAVSAILQNADGQFRSGTSLATELGVSRNAVWKAVCELREEGFPIETRKKIGYRMRHAADQLTPESVRTQIYTRVLGNTFEVLPQVGSTNDECRRRYRKGAPHGTVIAANAQSAGKGRQGHRFCSPPGAGLYFSVLLTEPLAIVDAPLLTACAAVAAARAIDALCGTKIQIKWVNDLMLGGKKCCGILTEGGVSLESGMLEYAIIGIGINVRDSRRHMPEELHDIVTSLEEEVPSLIVDRAKLLAAVLYYLEQMLPTISDRRFLHEYRSRSCLIGKLVRVTTHTGEIKKAVVEKIDDQCGLVIRDSFGNVETLQSAAASVKLVES